MEIVGYDEDKQAVLLTFLKFVAAVKSEEVLPEAFRMRSGIPESVPANRNAPIPEDERAGPLSGSGQAANCDLATTFLRHGLSTAIASTEARMFAPAATMNTLSQVPEDCCM